MSFLMQDLLAGFEIPQAPGLVVASRAQETTRWMPRQPRNAERGVTFDIGNGLLIFQIPQLDRTVVGARGEAYAGRVLRQRGLRVELDAAHLRVVTTQSANRFTTGNVPQFTKPTPRTRSKQFVIRTESAVRNRSFITDLTAVRSEVFGQALDFLQTRQFGRLG